MKNVTYINAGAGSGKTFTLTNILAARLCGKFYSGEEQTGSPAKVKPSEVILTTFTDLAAAEFREKARQEILKSSNFDAAGQMDSAAIGTVHSVALRFIKKFWYLLEYGADIQTITERDEDFYMSQSLAQIVAKDEYKQDLENFRNFRDRYDISDGYSHPDYLFWQRILNDVVEKMEYYDVDDVPESIDKNLETLNFIYTGVPVNNEDLEEMLQFLKKYYDYCKTQTTQKATEAAEAVKPLLNNINSIYDIVAVQSKIKPIGRDMDVKCPGYTDFIDKLDKAHISNSELKILVHFINSIFKLAKVWRDDYVAYKKRNHIISYNDMERIFKDLLEKDEVKDYIKSHYKLIMVDEFQDSNPIQLKIFNSLSEIIAEGGGHSYWVGDPKQAIYGFRGADTDLVNSVATHFKFYDDAKIHAEEGKRHLGSGRLVESWRSREKLVKLVNESFYEPFKEDGINELLIKLYPHFTNDNIHTNPLGHWNVEESNGQDAAEAIANKVKELLSTGLLVHHDKQDGEPSHVTYKDIAILCRKNDDCKNIVKALRKLDVPVSESEDSIMQRIEVMLVVTLLQFIQNPTSKHTIACLKRLLWGESTDDILLKRIKYVQSLLKEENDNFTEEKEKEELAKKDEWMINDTAVAALRQTVERYQNLSIPEIVRAVIFECNIPALCAKWSDKETRNQNLSTLEHLADDYDQRCLQMGLGTSISGFIYFLNSIEPDKEKDNLSDTVKVFTYHGSKGLEWPIVIMHGLGNDTLGDADFTKKQFMKVREVVLKDMSSEENPFDKEYYLHYFPNVVKPGAKNKPAPSLQDKISKLDFYKELKERARSEEKRLLYVGMTRAKDYLYTIGYKSVYDWLTNAGIKGANDDNPWGNPKFQPEKENIEKPDDDNNVATSTRQYDMIEKPSLHSKHESRYLSPSKIESFNGYTCHHAWKEKGIEIEHRGWGTDYDLIGSCIHDIFAVYQPNKDDINRKNALQVIGGYGFSDKLTGHVDAILQSVNWLYETLQKHYPRTEADKIEKEYPFMMTLASGQTLRGEMDLLWHYSDETGSHCVLIDYKTFPGVTLNEHTEQHYPQLSAYSTALKNSGINLTTALIYYPIHGIIHELRSL